MKHLLVTLSFVIGLFGSDLGWSSKYEQSLEKAKQEHKLVYVFITSDSCKWCRKFENTTLQDKTILQRLYSEFEVVHLSRDRHKIPKGFETSPIPRHYFVDSDGKILYSSLGHRGIECFDAFMDNAEDRKREKVNQFKEKN